MQVGLSHIVKVWALCKYWKGRNSSIHCMLNHQFLIVTLNSESISIHLRIKLYDHVLGNVLQTCLLLVIERIRKVCLFIAYLFVLI